MRRRFSARTEPEVGNIHSLQERTRKLSDINKFFARLKRMNTSDAGGRGRAGIICGPSGFLRENKTAAARWVKGCEYGGEDQHQRSSQELLRLRLHFR